MQDQHSEDAQALCPRQDESRPPPVAVAVTELQGPGQPDLHHSHVDGSAEREPFLGPLDGQSSESGSQTRLRNSPEGKSSRRVEHNGHVLQSLPLDEAAATQKPTRPKVKPFWKVWMLEMACILLSFSAFISIVIILSTFDQQSVSDWPFKMTLNTMLSFLVTLAKAAFMFPVSIAISRAQWSWFLQERPLYDFHVLDQASRGAWGSLILLWRIRGGHFIALGAILMVVSTLTSPVTQLAINYAVRDVVASGGEANTGAVRTITSPGDLIDGATHRAVSITALGDSEDMTGFIHPVSPLGAYCSTGNCTFDRYHSLGICMEMANISSQLDIQELPDPGGLRMSSLGLPDGSYTFPGEKTWKASLPGNIDFTHQSKLVAVTDILSGNASFGFQNNGDLLRTRIASLVLIYTAPVTHNMPSDFTSLGGVAKYMATIPEIQHEALEVLFHLCVQSYETSVRKGVETTRMVGSLAKPLEPETSFFLDMNCTSWLHNDGQSALRCENNKSQRNDTIRLESPVKAPAPRGIDSSEGGFGANYHSMERMGFGMKMGLAGTLQLLYHPRYFPDPATERAGADFVYNNLGGVLLEPRNMINQTRRNACLQNLYLNFATTLSATLRAVTPRNYTHNAYNITGKAWKEESYVYVTWGWISFLAVEIIMATGFLTLLILTEGRLDSLEDRLVFQDIKDSSLAVLVALDRECHAAAGGGLQPMDQQKNTAKSLWVKLKGNQVTLHTPGGHNDG